MNYSEDLSYMHYERLHSQKSFSRRGLKVRVAPKLKGLKLFFYHQIYKAINKSKGKKSRRMVDMVPQTTFETCNSSFDGDNSFTSASCTSSQSSKRIRLFGKKMTDTFDNSSYCSDSNNKKWFNMKTKNIQGKNNNFLSNKNEQKAMRLKKRKTHKKPSEKEFIEQVIPRFPVHEAMIKILPPSESESDEDSYNSTSNSLEEDGCRNFNAMDDFDSHHDPIVSMTDNYVNSLVNNAVSLKLKVECKVKKKLLNKKYKDEDICKLLLNLNTIKNNEEVSVSSEGSIQSNSDDDSDISLSSFSDPFQGIESYLGSSNTGSTSDGSKGTISIKASKNSLNRNKGASLIEMRKKSIIPTYAFDEKDENVEDLGSMRNIYFGPIAGSSHQFNSTSTRLRTGVLLVSFDRNADDDTLQSCHQYATEDITFDLAFFTRLKSLIGSPSTSTTVSRKKTSKNSNKVVDADEMFDRKRNDVLENRNVLDNEYENEIIDQIEPSLWKAVESRGEDNTEDSIANLTLRNLGEFQLRNGKYHDAMETLQKVVDHEENRINKGINLLLLGMSLYGLERFDDANKVNVQALTNIQRQNQSHFQTSRTAEYRNIYGNHNKEYILGKIFNNLGCGLMELGDWKSASRFFHCALHVYTQSVDGVLHTSNEDLYPLSRILRALDENRKTTHKITTPCLLDIIITLNNLAYVFVEMRKTDFACSCFESSLILQGIGTPNFALTIGTMESLASAYSKSKKNQRALEMYNLILDASHKIRHDYPRQYHRLISYIHASITNFHIQNEDLASAMEYVQSARSHQEIAHSLS